MHCFIWSLNTGLTVQVIDTNLGNCFVGVTGTLLLFVDEIVDEDEVDNIA